MSPGLGGALIEASGCSSGKFYLMPNATLAILEKSFVKPLARLGV
jgi:hypothetical protein